MFDADPSFRPLRRRDAYVALEDMALIGDAVQLLAGREPGHPQAFSHIGVIAGVTLARTLDESRAAGTGQTSPLT